MRITYILKKRFISSHALEYLFRLHAKLINGSDKIFVEEELTERDIKTINDGDAVCARQEIDEELQSRIVVPLFVQHENPLKYMGGFNSKYVYLTDSSYMSAYPVAEEVPQWIPDEGLENNEKLYDLIFIGRMRSNKDRLHLLRKLIVKAHVNRFGTIWDIASTGLSQYILKFLNHVWFPSKYNEFLWSLTNELRSLRRSKILEEIKRLAEKGRKVVIVGDDKVIETFSGINNVDIYDILPWCDVERLMRQSRIVVSTTPLHHSMLNERFVTAIRVGSIPLYEPYPQYQNILDEADEWFQYSYSNNSLYNKTERILDDYERACGVYERFRNAVLNKFSGDNAVLHYEKLIRKYSSVPNTDN